MKKLLLGSSLSLLLTFHGVSAQVDNTSPFTSSISMDVTGDSRMADMFPTFCFSVTNPEPFSRCGTQGSNFIVQANQLAGQRYQINLNQAIAGTRSDQYLNSTNFQPILKSKSRYLVIGYPAVNDTGQTAAGATYVTDPAAPFPGVTVDTSNVASVVAQNLLYATRQAVAAGKRVVLLHEPGNTSTNNGAITLANFTGNVPNSTTLNVTAISSGVIRTPQTVTPGTPIPGTPGLISAAIANPGSAQLGGSGVSAGTNIVAQLTGTDGTPCPAVGASVANSTCTGGIGTYSISASLNLSSQAFTSTYSLLAAVYELNAYIDAIGAAFPADVLVVNNNPALWNFTGSATAVSFKPNILIDGASTGTHYNFLGGYYAAVSFNYSFQQFIGVSDLSSANINDFSSSNPRSLIQNPLFNGASSGGTGGASCTTTGTVPVNWTQACGNVSTAVTITAPIADTTNLYGSAAVPLGGNQLTVAVTTSGADTYRLFSTSPSNSTWNVSDWMQGGMIVSVAAGSSKCAVYTGLDIATDIGTRTTYDGNNVAPTGGGFNDGPTTAYVKTFRNLSVPTLPNSATKSFVRNILYVKFSAAGNCTFTVTRPSLYRVKVYNPATGTFFGWLHGRDLDRAANDNYPADLLKAG